MEYIRRHIESEIMDASAEFSAILVTGPRRCGKSTMLKKLAEEEGKGRRYVSLDDWDVRDIAVNDPKRFLQTFPPPVFIDEVQYAPGLFTYIKIYIDEHHNPGDFWMSGSQIYRLMKGVRESLAGRVILFSLTPMSQREIAGRMNLPFTADYSVWLREADETETVPEPELFERIWRGSMPERITKENVSQRFYVSYLSTYIERDVAFLSPGTDATKFYRFMRASAARCSCVLNYKAIAVDAEISEKTCRDWMNILETLGIVFMLHPYSNNMLKRMIKAPKLYFYDTGLVCALTGWLTPETAETGAMSGALLEDYVVSEIVKGFYNAGVQTPPVYYYRDTDAKEIDLIVEGPEELCPVEIKKTASPDKRIAKTFSVIEKASKKRGASAILCTSMSLYTVGENVAVIPISLI